MEFKILFASLLRKDGFCFIGIGSINIEENKVILTGKRPWKLFFYYGFFISMFVLLVGWFLSNVLEIKSTFVFFIICLGLIFTLIELVKYFARRYIKVKSLIFCKSEIVDVSRKGKKITFRAPSKDNWKLKRSVFMAFSEKEAESIQSQLRI